MARLPVPGSDDGQWGDILNDFLSVSLASDGTLVDGAVSPDVIQDNSVTTTKIVDGAVTDAKLASADLVDISVLTPSDDDVLQRKAGAWTNRTPAQLKLDLALNSTDVGLGNVDNTSDANKPISTATQTALDLKAPLASPTFTGTVTLPVGLTGVLRADTGVVSTDTDVTDIVSTASTGAAGKVELATIAETSAGTDTDRAVTPDGLAGSVFGTENVTLAVLSPGAPLTTGDGKLYFRVPSPLNGMDLIGAAAAVTTTSSSGTPTIQLARGRQANATSAHSYVDMLSTRITIDVTEYDSKDATTAAVIDTTNDDVATGDLIRVDIDVAGTSTAGLFVTLEFRLP